VKKRKPLASTGIRTPDRSTRSESLYRLSYPSHSTSTTTTTTTTTTTNNNNNKKKKKKKKKKKYLQGSRRGNCSEFYTDVTCFEYRPSNWVMRQGFRYFSLLLQYKQKPGHRSEK